MKTPDAGPKRRRNPHLARLDRQIRLHGEACEIIHTIGSATQTKFRVSLRGIVKTFGVEQLIAGLTQTNYLVIISPTDLRNTKWPGPRGPATVASGNLPNGQTPPKDFVIPTTADAITFRAAQKAIGQATAIYDGDDCVRIELKVLG